jgi:tetratricopeptide (TPR) repeat protein
MWYVIIGLGALVALFVGVNLLLVWRSTDYRNARAGRLKQEARLHVERGDLKAALKKSVKALSIYEGIGQDGSRVATHIAIGRIYAAMGEAARAVEHMETAYRDSAVPGYEEFRTQAAEWLADRAMERGLPWVAADYYQEAFDLEQAQAVWDDAPAAAAAEPGAVGMLDLVRAMGRPRPTTGLMKRIYGLLARANIAAAYIAAGDYGQAKRTLDSLVTDLNALKTPDDPGAPGGLRSAWALERLVRPETVETARQSSSVLLKDIRQAARMAAEALNGRWDPQRGLDRAYQVLVGFRPMLAGILGERH